MFALIKNQIFESPVAEIIISGKSEAAYVAWPYFFIRVTESVLKVHIFRDKMHR